MKYFSNIQSLNDLKDQYRKLAFANHPDKGGSTEAMQGINNEYDVLFPIYKDKEKVKTHDTAQSTRNEFYTAWGWKGENFNSNLRTTDIAKIIREYAKEKYPTYKFSVCAPDYNSLHISLMEAPQDVFNPEQLNEYEKKEYDEQKIDMQLNPYHFQKDERLTELCREIMYDIMQFAQTYNFNDSDAMIDYFHTNFYLSVNIGQWDKPFKIVEKTARIKAEKPKSGNAEPKTNLNLKIVDYSEKAIAVYGDTYEVKEELENLGGKFNRYLKDGTGYIFSKKRKKEVEKFVERLHKKPENMNNINERTPETIELNNKLEIVKIDSDYKFKNARNVLETIFGYCFYIEGKGYLAYENDTTPYTPAGGVDALQSILNDGGLLSYEGIKFINPENEIGVQRITCF